MTDTDATTDTKPLLRVENLRKLYPVSKSLFREAHDFVHAVDDINFEIAPGGYSTLEQHEHEHVVIPLRGQGEAQFGCYVYKVQHGDVVYVAPNDPHQFRNPEESTEPFGFLCLVNAERDAPQLVDGLGACFICE